MNILTDLIEELKTLSKQSEITGLEKLRIGEIAREIETLTGHITIEKWKNDYSN